MLAAALERSQLLRGLPRTFWYLWVASLANRLGSFLFTFLAVYLRDTRGMTVERAGLVVALYGVGAMAAGPVGGALADRLGRRGTMLLSTTLGALAMLQLGFARAPLHIALSVLFLGFFSDLYRPASSAAVADLVPPADRPRAFGLIFWAVNLGFAGASVLAGLLAKVSYWLLFIGDAVTTLIFGAIVFFLVPETRPRGGDTPTRVPLSELTVPYRDGTFVSFMLVQFLFAVVFCQSLVTLPLDMRAHGISLPEFGRLIAINGVLIVLLQPFVSRWAARGRRGLILSAGCLLTGVGFGLARFGGSMGVYALSIVIWTLGEIAMSAVAPALIADLAPLHLRGSYQGAYQIVWGAASLLAPFLGTQVLGRAGSQALWTLCLFLGVSAAVLHLVITPARRRRLAAHPEAEALLRREDGEPAAVRDTALVSST